jgi:hypothetical protein
MYAGFLKEVASAGLPAVPGPVEIVTSSKLASLPEPAQLSFSEIGLAPRFGDVCQGKLMRGCKDL